MSSSARRRIAAAQRARWARVKAQRSGGSEAQETPKRKMSPAVRARIAAAQKARWAKNPCQDKQASKSPNAKDERRRAEAHFRSGKGEVGCREGKKGFPKSKINRQRRVQR